MTLWRRVYEERKSVVLPVGALIVASIVMLLFVVIPLGASVAASESEALDSKMALANALRLDRQTRDARASKDRADTELRRFYAEVLPRDSATAQKTTNLWLQQAAQDAGLVFQGSHFDSADVRGSKLSRAYTRVTLLGRYTSIRKFLYALETAEEFIVVEKVELAEAGGSQPTTAGLLAISLTASTYFLTPGAK
jgi:hypothetical protein